MGWGEPLGRDAAQDRAAAKVVETARAWRTHPSTGNCERLLAALAAYDAAETAAESSPVRAGWRALHDPEPETGRRCGW